MSEKEKPYYELELIGFFNDAGFACIPVANLPPGNDAAQAVADSLFRS